ncbi:Histidine kinase-like ATPase domain-containing protein, partial [Sinosporangium album]
MSEVRGIESGQICWSEKLLGEVVLAKMPASVGAAREAVLDIVGRDHVRKDDILLVVSELVTNSVVHADRGTSCASVRLRLLASDDLLIVEVYDPGSFSDAPRLDERQDTFGEGGRGLYLVSLLCGGRWSTRSLGAGTERLVWAALPLTGQASPAREVVDARRKDSRQAIRFTKNARFAVTPGGKLRLPKIGDVPVRWSRSLPSGSSSVTVVKDSAGRYFASFVVGTSHQPLPEAGSEIGIDLGLTHFAITSDGRKAANPRLLRRAAKKLRKAQKALSRKEKGSANRAKAKAKVAKAYAKVADTRR